MMMWGWDWGIGLWSFLWVVFVLIVFIIPWVFFLITLRGVLERVSPQNRAMPPEQVWLNLIPVFNLGWFVYTVAKVRDSVRAEYYSRNWPVSGDLGYNVGLAAAIVGICAVIFSWVPMFGWWIGIAAIVCWVIYWLKMADVRNRLAVGAHWPGAGAPPPYGPYGPYDRGPGRGGSPYAPPYPPGGPTGQPPHPGGQPYGRPPSAPPVAGKPSGPPSQQTPPVVRPVAGEPSVAGEPPAGEPPAAGETLAGEPPVGETPPADQPFGAAAQTTEAGEQADTGMEETPPDAARSRQCAVCDTTVAADDKFCRGCGLPLNR